MKNRKRGWKKKESGKACGRERERECLKKYCQVGRWVASLGPARIASLCSMKMGYL